VAGVEDVAAPVAVLVTTGEGRATGIRIAQAQLQESAGTAQIRLSDLVLCDSAAGGACGELASIRAQTGRFTCGSQTKRSAIHAPRKVHWIDQLRDTRATGAAGHQSDTPCSSLGLKIFGFALLLLGTALAWWINVKLRCRAAGSKRLGRSPPFARRLTP